jgi:hypothetical protein
MEYILLEFMSIFDYTFVRFPEMLTSADYVV